MEKLCIIDWQKPMLGMLIRKKRKEKQMTQQMLLHEAGHPISLRTLISLEQGASIKDDEVYDRLLAVFHASYCYSSSWLDELPSLAENARLLWIHYDDKACAALLSSAALPSSYLLEATWRDILLLIAAALSSISSITAHELAFLSASYPFCPSPIQVILRDILYAHEYTYAHREKQLHILYHKYFSDPPLCDTRSTLCAILHLCDKQQDYLYAYELVKACLQKEEAAKDNPIALFGCYSWLMTLSSFLQKEQMEFWKKKAEALLKKEKIPDQKRYSFYCNLASAYSKLNEIEKSLESYQKADVLHHNSLLPELIWICALQHRLDKTLPALDYDIDVSSCSDVLQTCWLYFVKKNKKEPPAELEAYIMKKLLPLLKTLAVEFRIVYREQLCTLLPYTRNYRNLLLFDESCPTSASL